MKKLILTLAVLLITSTSFADVYVRGYNRSDGTYVSPHYRSSPNDTTYDNYSTKGNYNPYTGESGINDPGIYAPTYTYSQPTVFSQPSDFSSGDMYGF